MKFRSRKSGQHYPVSQGMVRPRGRPTRTIIYGKLPKSQAEKVDEVLEKTKSNEAIVTIHKGGDTETELKAQA